MWVDDEDDDEDNDDDVDDDGDDKICGWGNDGDGGDDDGVTMRLDSKLDGLSLAIALAALLTAILRLRTAKVSS